MFYLIGLPQPTLLMQLIPSKLDVIGAKNATFAIIPCGNSLHRSTPVLLYFGLHFAQSMDGSKQLHAVGRFKTLNDLRDPLEVHKRL